MRTTPSTRNRSKAVAIGPVEEFRIESEAEADAYLKDLLAKPEYRSLAEVRSRAAALVRDKRLQDYFVERAKEILKTYDR
jgi:hypothetical protein